MNRETFNSQYNPANRCLVVFRDQCGDRRQGIALDGVQQSVGGAEFVYVDSFAHGVPLYCIESVQDTGKPWADKGAL